MPKIQKLEKLEPLVAGVLGLMKVFDRDTNNGKILMAKTLITILNSFNNFEEKQEVVEITKEWCDDEVKQHPGRDDLRYYENFFNSIQTLASNWEDPKLVHQVTLNINKTKEILEEKVKELEKEPYILRF